MGKLTDLAKAITQPEPGSNEARLRELREAAHAQDPLLEIPEFLRREMTPEVEKRLDKLRARAKAAHDNPGRFIKNPPDPDKVRDTGLGMSPSALRQHGAQTKEEIEMAKQSKAAARKSRTTAKATKSPARAAKPASERARYDWAKHEEAAAEGKMPPRLDFSAETHKRFRPTLKLLEEAAKAGDAKALRAVKINLVSSSPKAMDRWRGMCLKALAAQAGGAPTQANGSSGLKPSPAKPEKPKAAAPAKAPEAKAAPVAKPAAAPAAPAKPADTKAA